MSKARSLVRSTMHVEAALARLVEGVVLPEAPRMTDAELRQRCAELLIEFDPLDAAERHREARKRRTMRKWNEPDGMANLLVHSTVDDIATIWEALTGLGQAALAPPSDRDLGSPMTGPPPDDPLTVSGPPPDGAVAVSDPVLSSEPRLPAVEPVDSVTAASAADDPPTLDKSRVDALVDLCGDVLIEGGWRQTTLPDRHGRKPHVQVLMPFDALLGGDSPCELSGYGPITADQARVIAADATLTRLVCDPLSGQLFDYGGTRYQPPQHLKDFVLMRDQRCIAPGCRLPANRCQLDHRVPFGKRDGTGQGGSTSAENLAAPCQHHHRAKDGGGYQLTKTADGHYDWTTPLGRTYRRPATRLWKPPRSLPHADNANDDINRAADIKAQNGHQGSEPDDPPPF